MDLGAGIHSANGGYVRFDQTGKKLFVSSWHGSGLDVYDVTDASSANGLKLKASIRTVRKGTVGGHFILSPDSQFVVFNDGLVVEVDKLGSTLPKQGGGAPGGVPGMGFPGGAPGIGFPGGALAGSSPYLAGVGPGIPPVPGAPPMPGGVNPGVPMPGVPGKPTPPAGVPAPGPGVGVPGKPMPGGVAPMPAAPGFPGGVAPVAPIPGG